jgi:tetratricopeptide (TPR) repeat protein/CHAT domain-containing protein
VRVRVVAAWVVLAWALVAAIGTSGPGLAQSDDELDALNRQVVAFLKAEKFADAAPLAQRAIQSTKARHGEKDPRYATALNNLAYLYQAQGRHEEAEPLYRRSLAIREMALGRDHRDVGTALNNLAFLYQAQGRHAEAEPLYKRSLAIRETALGREHVDVAQSLANLALLYKAQARLKEAEPLSKRSLAIYEKALGPQHLDVARSLDTLASLYRAQGRYAEAEPPYKRSLAILENALGTAHPEVASSLNNLALLYQDQGRYAEAEPLYNRILAISEKALGPEHPRMARSLNNLATLYRAQGRLTEAEPLYKRSLVILEKALGREHLDVATALNNLAALYRDRGRYAEAEPLSKRSLAIRETALGRDHPDVATALNTLAALDRAQGRYAEAEPLYRRSLAINEKALGRDHPEVARLLNNLASFYQDQGRYAEAEAPYRRSLAINEKALGRDHPEVATSLSNLAVLYRDQTRYAEAEPLYKRSLAIRETALGRGHPDVARSLNNLASFYQDQGRDREAEALFRRSLAIYEKTLGPEHPHLAVSLSNLALLYTGQGLYGEAERASRRSLAILEKALGPEHPDVAEALNNLALLELVQSDWTRAAEHFRRGSGIIARRAERGLAGTPEGSPKGEAQRLGKYFSGLVKATHRLVADGRASGAPAAKMFETAQWPQASEAAAVLAQMAARSATGSPELAALVRERQDLVREAQIKDKQLIGEKSKAPPQRNAGVEKALTDRLAAIDARLDEIKVRLAKDFPEYAGLAIPAPASVSEVQAQLRRDEALVLFLDTPPRGLLPEETFIWVVTKSEVRWVRSELGSGALRREVGALRCGLDAAAWEGAGGETCAKALGMRAPGNVPDPLPFDRTRAFKLYSGLFGQVEDLIKGRHLLIVPSGTLTQLPFQVLVTEAPEGVEQGAERTRSDIYRHVAWLGARQPITVLPAASSLKALRAQALSGRGSKAYLGIGNPLLDGPDARYAASARAAGEKQRCPIAPRQRTALAKARSSVAPINTRSGLAKLEDIKLQVPLPETADELCQVAEALHAELGEIRLGRRATESEVKRLSTTGDLAQYRVLHFATHGALAGELRGSSEPGLILTPPEQASEQDDGYLSASEIAALKLDADWVILSACNTAAGGAADAEALSGMARAFIYAGARALLVSHWAVDSNAAMKLVTRAVGEIARNPGVGRAEAMRRAMAALIETGTAEAHPANWAPFVVVGEGATAR